MQSECNGNFSTREGGKGCERAAWGRSSGFGFGGRRGQALFFSSLIAVLIPKTGEEALWDLEACQ